LTSVIGYCVAVLRASSSVVEIAVHMRGCASVCDAWQFPARSCAGDEHGTGQAARAHTRRPTADVLQWNAQITDRLPVASAWVIRDRLPRSLNTRWVGALRTSGTPGHPGHLTQSGSLDNGVPPRVQTVTLCPIGRGIRSG